MVTAAEMDDAMQAAASDADIVVMAAAVADFRPAEVADNKIKKADGIPSVELVPTADILAGLGAGKRPGQIVVGFAAETNDVVDNARGKLERKNADLIVANDVSAPGVGFAHDTNAVTIVGHDGLTRSVPLGTKEEIATAVFDAVAELLPVP